MTIPNPINPSAGKKAAPNWFVAQLKPGGFALARQNLERQSFKTFMPLQEKTSQNGRRAKQVLQPFFPGYIFINFDAKVTAWRVINSTYGVRTLVMGAAHTPLGVPAGLVEALRARCDVEDRILPPASFAKGASVRIVEGPFQGLLAKVARASSGYERVHLLLELMGRSTPIDCAPRKLELL